MNILDTLTEVFNMVFEEDSITLSSEMTANDIEKWDSLSHVILITAVEEKFNIRFSQKELMKFKNVGDLCSSIESKL